MVSRPSEASTSTAAMVSPSPAPSTFCASGARQNRSVAWPSWLAVMPGPVSRTVSADPAVGGAYGHRHLSARRR